MSCPKTCEAYRRATSNPPRTIEPSTETVPMELGSNDVLTKIHAVSLNFHDVAMLEEGFPLDFDKGGIPVSDCAAEALGIGRAVKDFKVGDRVAPIFDHNNTIGEEDTPSCARGGNAPGVLAEYAVFVEDHLVYLPKHLSWEEASTIGCAGVTAWNALNFPPEPPRDGLTVLLQGTGGVSLFALLIANAASIKTIITSSSN